LFSAEMPCFCACGKIVCFYRAALFPRLRQDTFISAEPLFFDSRTIRYFLSRSLSCGSCTIFYFWHHPYRLIHARYFRSHEANTRFVRARDSEVGCPNHHRRLCEHGHSNLCRAVPRPIPNPC
jgi:hypothetical protein